MISKVTIKIFTALFVLGFLNGAKESAGVNRIIPNGMLDNKYPPLESSTGFVRATAIIYNPIRNGGIERMRMIFCLVISNFRISKVIGQNKEVKV